MSLDEFKKLDATQLREKEAELRKQLFSLRNQAVSEKVKDTSQFGKTRKDIARVLTLLHQQELAAAKK